MASEAPDMLHDLQKLLDSLEQVQSELRSLYARKRQALRSSRSDQLTKLLNPERVLVHRLRDLLRQRYRLLEEARRRGFGVTDLRTLAEQLVGTSDGAEEQLLPLMQRIQAVREAATQLRQESWVQWIVAHRAYQHQSELLALIARGGGVEPVYHEHGESYVPNEGGALLDHAV